MAVMTDVGRMPSPEWNCIGDKTAGVDTRMLIFLILLRLNCARRHGEDGPGLVCVRIEG